MPSLRQRIHKRMLVRPFKHQVKGVRFIEQHDGRCLIADEMGAGKTYQAIAWLALHPEARPVVIECPASMKLKWQRELEEFAGIKSTVLHGYKPYGVKLRIWEERKDDGPGRITRRWFSTPALRGTFLNEEWHRIEVLDDTLTLPEPKLRDVVIVNYDVLGDWEEHLRLKLKPKTLIVDEAHKLKHESAKRTKRTKLLARKCQYDLRLSGTFITNRPIELFSNLNGIAPKDFDSRMKYAFRYCSPKRGFRGRGWDFNGAGNLEELHQRLSKYMIRRMRADVLKHLPPKLRSVIPVEISNREEYEKAKDSFVQWLTEKKGKEAAKRARGAVALVKLLELKKLAAQGKLNTVFEWIDDFLEDTERKLVVFAHHRDVMARLMDRFPHAVKVDGSVPQKKRQEAVDRFQNDPRVRLFFGEFEAAGTGLTLTASDTVAFVELAWTPGEHDQAEDRCLVKGSLVFCLPSVHNKGMGLTGIENIKIGDRVLTHTGFYRRVTATKKRFHQGLFSEIRYVGGEEPLTCTHDHKILARRNGVLGWVDAHQLLPTDHIAFPKEVKTRRLERVEIKDEWRLFNRSPSKPGTTPCVIKGCAGFALARGLCNSHYRRMKRAGNELPPVTKQVNGRYIRLPDSIKITDDWLYLLGWYVAEGFSSIKKGKSRFVSFSGHQKEWHTLEKIGKTLEALGLKFQLRTAKGSLGIEGRAASGELARWFHSWFGHGARNKTLPPEIIHLPPDQAGVFLKGYVDGDGHCRKNQVSWTSASRTLCYQISMLAIRCGFCPNMEKQKTAKGGFVWCSTYSTTRSICDQDERYIYRPIRSVMTYKDKQYVYDLTVEKDHSFAVGFATAHNCNRIGQTSSHVDAYYFVGEDTVDELNMDALQRKREVVGQVLDGRDTSGDVPSQIITALMRSADILSKRKQRNERSG